MNNNNGNNNNENGAGLNLDLNLGPGGGGNNGGNAPNFPWATGAPAGIHTLAHLLAHGIAFVEGETVCRQCERRDNVKLDLRRKYDDIAEFLVNAVPWLNDRAPREWMHPALDDCGACKGVGCVKPVVAERKEDINWLFLFLGQKLGICKMEELRWHCRHTGNHRTGAKNRLLYLSYLAICRQLQPGAWAPPGGGAAPPPVP